jgi:7-cyano-7-deazaguanine synthase
MPASNDVAVLASGGLDSAILSVDYLREFDRVFPIFVSFGLRWEEAEREGLEAFLGAVARPGLMPLTVLREPIVEVYGTHWSTGGGEVPGADSPDKAVYLPGRNLLLVAKAAVWCNLKGVEFLALGSLSSNPFSDSSDAFFDALASAIHEAMPGRLTLLRPFSRRSKRDVMELGRDLPLWLTWSCLNPQAGAHCGICNKCAERRKAFETAGIPDRTVYRSLTHSHA